MNRRVAAAAVVINGTWGRRRVGRRK